MKNNVSICLELIKKYCKGKLIEDILVVGCGDGKEALGIKNLTGVKVIGVDINPNFDEEVKKEVELIEGDATSLEFKDESFDVVYCYHVLEHIHEYERALFEVKRVLKSGGYFLVGVPNKNRIFAYISSPISFYEKLLWNFNDWKAKLHGNFSNQKGAHAGFYEAELFFKLSQLFSVVFPIRDEYYFEKYTNRRSFIKFLRCLSLDKFLFPSNYFLCIRK